MTSSIFNKMGLGKLDVGWCIIVLLVLVIALLIVVINMLVKQNRLSQKYEKFMQGKDAISLEEQIAGLIGTVNQLCAESDAHAEDINTIFKKHEFAFQKMGLIKYDAYKEMGGKLSYALTLLDENNNGFLTNSVHSSTGCYSYTKRIKQGTCDLDLSPEEKASLDKALNS